MSRSNEQKLDELFIAYRESVPDCEPSVNFTPELWRRIDQRRKVTFSMTRFARGIVTGALALCFAMTALTWTQSSSSVYSATYVDVLEQERQNEVDMVGENL